MNDFYFGAVLLAVIGLVVVLFPWLVKRKVNAQQSLTNTRLVKQRLAELAQEQEHGLLTADDKYQAENELKLALLDEVNSEEITNTKGKWALVLGIFVGVLVGGGSYYHASQFAKVERWQQVQSNTSSLGQRILQGDESLSLKDMQDFALGLRTRLIDDPEDPIGWMLLGRVSGALNRVDSSIAAFERSLKYDPANVGTMTSYANALIMKGTEQEMLTAKRVLLHVVSVEPQNTHARGMLAVAASELGDKQLALDNWTKLREFVPETDPNYTAISQRIQQLSAELGVEGTYDDHSSKVNQATTGKRVVVKVELSPALSNKLPKQGVLFVFAQDASGASRIPAAVVKLSLRELSATSFPIEVQLSDENAMMNNFTLSQLQQAKIVARVSVDGNVASAPGELQGEHIVDFSASEQQEVNILINKEW